MIIIHLERKINPEKEAEYIDVMKKLAEVSRTEAGNISYSFYKDMEKEHTYGIVEVWENSEVLDVHQNTEHFRAFMKQSKAEKFAQGPPRVIVYEGEVSPN